MEGLEFELWDSLEGIIFLYGRLEISSEIKGKLKQLSDKANGWIYYDTKEEEKFVSIEEWTEIRKNKKHEP